VKHLIPTGWLSADDAASRIDGGADQLWTWLRDEKLTGHILVTPRRNPMERVGPMAGPDDGSIHEIEARFWRTQDARNAVLGRWVEAPVQRVVLHHKGQPQKQGGQSGGVLIIREMDLEKAIAAARPPGTAGAERRAEADLRDRCAKGETPTKAVWTAEAQQADATLSARAAGRAWDAVARDHPELSSLRKPKTKR
jgi:hypothetical protein